MTEEPDRLPATLGDHFRVAEWEIDVASHRMRRGGKTVKLEPRAMAVLVYLAGRAGQVVTREELEEAVWSGRVVGYEALSNAIAKLRRAFQDSPGQGRIIETIPKSGYRLVAEVEPLPGSRGPEAAAPDDLDGLEADAHPGGNRRGSGSRPLALAAGGVALLLLAATGMLWQLPWRPTDPGVAPPSAAGNPSVAVLPFDNLSTDPDQEFFADGLTGDLITDLSRISGLFVVAHHSVFAYEDQSRPIADIARELGVRYVIEGSVQRADGRIRINARLIEASTGMNLWTERYERDAMEVLTLQNEVTGDIVDTLAVKLTDRERTQLAHRGTDDLEAYDYYLRAEHVWNSCGNDDCGRAFALYRRALAIDPEFVDAYARLAWIAMLTWHWDWSDVMPGAAARRLAYDAASQVLALDEGDPRAYAVLAMIQATEAHYAQALKSARSAVHLDPNNADTRATLAWILSLTGDHAEAKSEMETALRINPRPPSWYNAQLGIIAFLQRDYEATTALLSATGDYYLYRLWAAMIRAEIGRLDEARADLEVVYDNVPFANLAYYRTMFSHFKRNKDVEHILAALKKAGLPDWPFGYAPISENRLDRRTLESITFGHTWTGHDSRGNAFMQQMSDDGHIAFRGHASMLTGSFRIKGNRLCVNYPNTLAGREDCGHVYRNPEGATEGDEDYVRVSIGDIYYFSISPNQQPANRLRNPVDRLSCRRQPPAKANSLRIDTG